MKRTIIIFSFLLSTLITWGQYQPMDTLFNGTLNVVGNDTLLYDSVSSTNTSWKLIQYTGSLSSGVIDFREDGFLVINSDTIPIQCAAAIGLRNYNKADTLFFQSNDTAIIRIASYNTPTPDINNYWDEINPSTNITWIDGVSGDDGTGDGSKGNPYKTIEFVWKLTLTNDTIFLKSGIQEFPIDTYFVVFKGYKWFTIGNVDVLTTNASFGVRIGDVDNSIISGFDLHVGVAAQGIRSQTSGGRIDNCNVREAGSTGTVYLQDGTNSTINNCKIVSSTNPINATASSYTLNLNNSYIKGTGTAACVEVTTASLSTFNMDGNRFVGTAFKVRNNNTYNFTSNIIEGEINNFTDGAYSGSIDISDNTATATANNVFITTGAGAPTLNYNWNIDNNTFNWASFSNISIRLTDQKVKITNNLSDGTNAASSTGLCLIDMVNRSLDTLEILNNHVISASNTANIVGGINIGNEAIGIGDDSLRGSVISGNYIQGILVDANTPTPLHAIYANRNDNILVENNFIENTTLGIVLKGSINDDSTTIAKNNIIKNCGNSLQAKGYQKVRFLNNTIYNTITGGVRGFYIHDNEDDSDKNSDNCLLRNNIVYTINSSYAAIEFETGTLGLDSDYNVLFATITGKLEGSTTYDFSTWQGLGYDLNSYNTDPLLDANLCPASNSDAVFNGLNLGAPYNTGLVCGTSFPNPTTRSQTFPSYTIGAIVIDKQINSVVRVVGGSLWGFGTGVAGY